MEYTLDDAEWDDLVNQVDAEFKAEWDEYAGPA